MQRESIAKAGRGTRIEHPTSSAMMTGTRQSASRTEALEILGISRVARNDTYPFAKHVEIVCLGALGTIPIRPSLRVVARPALVGQQASRPSSISPGKPACIAPTFGKGLHTASYGLHGRMLGDSELLIGFVGRGHPERDTSMINQDVSSKMQDIVENRLESICSFRWNV